MKVITHKEVAELVKPGTTLMIGGFLGVGTPEGIIDQLIENGVENLTVIGNDTAFEDRYRKTCKESPLQKSYSITHWYKSRNPKANDRW